MKIKKPLIKEISFNQKSLSEIKQQIRAKDINERELLIDYPTVYIVNDKEKNNKFSVYIGETSNILSRMDQHLSNDSNLKRNWENLSISNTSKIFVIGHEYFNKSLTLDVENKLMHYLSSVENVEKIYNRRTNQQNKYFTSDYFEDIFSKVWEELRKRNKSLFPIEQVIKESALFKASPFHKLSKEQLDAKDKIKSKIISALHKEEKGQLILVTGEAGSGKTVLMSSLFYEVNKLEEEFELEEFSNISVYLLVNHDQQKIVYEQIAKKLGLKSDNTFDIVNKPTSFINNHDPKHPVDVIIVDEAHLLLTQGKQSYQGKNHLNDLLDRAKVVVAVFDINQVLTTEQYWEDNILDQIKEKVESNDNLITLRNQMRINADANTVDWIRTLVDEQVVLNIHEDSLGYDLQIFNSAAELHSAIKSKNKHHSHGLSRLVATFDWEYVNKRKPDNAKYWMIRDGDWELPWNLQLETSKEEKRINRDKAWAEQAHTINEAGSTYTIQGFDLNYAGVIIGPSVKYRNGKIVFDKNASFNNKATQNRTLSNGEKQNFSEILLRNELNVLLTRGVRGLYLYAVDDELQEALLAAQRGELEL